MILYTLLEEVIDDEYEPVAHKGDLFIYVYIGNLELAGISEASTTWLQYAYVEGILTFLGSHIGGATKRSSHVGRMGLRGALQGYGAGLRRSRMGIESCCELERRRDSGGAGILPRVLGLRCSAYGCWK